MLPVSASQWEIAAYKSFSLMADRHEIDANPNISCSYVKGRCDFLLIYRMAYYSVEEKNAYRGYAQEVFEAHDESQEAYNYYA